MHSSLIIFTATLLSLHLPSSTSPNWPLPNSWPRISSSGSISHWSVGIRKQVVKKNIVQLQNFQQTYHKNLFSELLLHCSEHIWVKTTRGQQKRDFQHQLMIVFSSRSVYASEHAATFWEISSLLGAAYSLSDWMPQPRYQTCQARKTHTKTESFIFLWRQRNWAADFVLLCHF